MHTLFSSTEQIHTLPECTGFLKHSDKLKSNTAELYQMQQTTLDTFILKPWQLSVPSPTSSSILNWIAPSSSSAFYIFPCLTIPRSSCIFLQYPGKYSVAKWASLLNRLCNKRSRFGSCFAKVHWFSRSVLCVWVLNNCVWLWSSTSPQFSFSQEIYQDKFTRVNLCTRK